MFRASEFTALPLRGLARRVTLMYAEALKPHDLTIGQYGILVGVQRNDGLGIAVLAEVISMDASTLSRLVRPLAAKGLLAIATDPGDARARRLRLTPEGAARLRRATPSWQAAQAAVRARLGDERLSALRFMIDDAYNQL